MVQKIEYTVLDLIESAVRNSRVQPLNLGGVGGLGGGAGGPPGGFIGRLPQYQVAYDTLEAATLDTLPSGLSGASGWSLVDNLNHIRYRLNILESGGSIVVVDDNDIIEYPDTTHIHFSGAGVTVLDLGGGEVQVIITATGSGGGGGSLTAIDQQLYYPIGDGSFSDIGSPYYYMPLEIGDILSTNSGALTSETLIDTYISPSGKPGSTEVKNCTAYIRAQRLISSGGKDVRLKVKLYKRNLAGTETLLATSSETANLTDSHVLYTLTLSGTFSLLQTDRLVLKVYGSSYGAGFDQMVQLSYGNQSELTRLDVTADHGEFTELSFPGNSLEVNYNAGTLEVSVNEESLDPHNDDRYLLLDASNDPITGDLEIEAQLSVTPPRFEEPLYLEARSRDAGEFDQIGVLSEEVSDPVLWLFRYTDDSTPVLFSQPYLYFDDDDTDAVYSGGTLQHYYDGTLRTELNLFAAPSGVVALFDSVNAITQSGRLISLRNQGNEKFSVDGSGNTNIPTGSTYNINGVPHTHAGGSGATPHEPGGRLSLVSATPVMSTEQAAKTTIYYTPYKGDLVPIYDGSWTEETFAELSLALDSDSGHTGYHQSGKNFDLFIYDDAGTLRLVSGPAWTNDTTRATALEYKNGILMNAASMTARFGSASGNTVTVAQDRGTYVGTFRASANGTTTWEIGGKAAGGDAGLLYLWNCYNRVVVAIGVFDSTDSWTYSTSTWRAYNNSATNRVSFVCGLNEDAIQAIFTGRVTSNAAAGGIVGVGLDSTTAFGGTTGTGLSSQTMDLPARHYALPGIGFHFVSALEIGNGGVSHTFYGDQGAPTVIQTGLHFIGNF